MTYGARLPALTARTPAETGWDAAGDTGQSHGRARQSSTVHAAVASCRPGRHRRRCRVLICYLLDVNALFDGDGTRCAEPATPRTPRAHPSNY